MQRFGLPGDKIAEISGYIEQKELNTMFDALVENYWKSKNEGIAIGREAGIAIGRAEGMALAQEKANQEKLENARRMKNDGFSDAQIAKYSGLSLESIENL
jgi:predicted transposase YdaD